ncbi:MAG: serine hydrolase [Patescibacteria group bacterium]
MRKNKTVVLVLVAFLLGSATAIAIDRVVAHKDTPIAASRQIREGGGVYTNPLLECDVAQGAIDAPKARFERDLESKVEDMLARPSITEVAVYYRDLNNGPSFGINQDKEFFPASLLKTPLMMAFLKHAETRPGFLTQRVTYQRSEAPESAHQTIRPDVALVSGEEYTVEQLLEHLIKYSDNDALTALYPLLPEKEYVSLFDRLGVKGVNLSDAQTTLTVVEYSTFFRVLYNASFLSQEMSEKALELLVGATYDGGLSGGVPRSVPVAHKFGERDLGDGFYQLHDCGIVYEPQKQYLLCVMTRGKNQNELSSVIKEISKYTYEQVSK